MGWQVKLKQVLWFMTAPPVFTAPPSDRRGISSSIVAQIHAVCCNVIDVAVRGRDRPWHGLPLTTLIGVATLHSVGPGSMA